MEGQGLFEDEVVAIVPFVPVVLVRGEPELVQRQTQKSVQEIPPVAQALQEAERLKACSWPTAGLSSWPGFWPVPPEGPDSSPEGFPRIVSPSILGKETF